jgi:O-antigen ligase
MTVSVYPESRAASVLPRVLFFLFVLASFLFYSPVIVGGGEATGTPDDGGDAIRQVGFSVMFLSIVLTLVITRGARELFNVPIALVVLLLWCWLSVAWAIDPGASFRRIAFTSVVVLGIVYSVSMMDDGSVISIIGLCFALVLMADWAAMAALPQAVHPPADLEFEAAGGAWRGIHMHRNAAGAFGALAALYFLHLLFAGRRRAVAAVFLALSVGFLFFTGSKTSNGVVGVAAAAALLFGYGYRYPVVRKVLSIWALGLVLVALFELEDYLPDVLAFLEDPRALTGRTQIWEMLVEYAEDHLLLGSGYGSFWAIGNASPVNALGKAWYSTLNVGHNGYLDLLVQTGAVGLAIAVAALVAHPMYLLFTREIRPHMRWFLGAVFTFFWLHNLTETSLLDRANFVWVVPLSALCILVRQSKGSP